MLNESQKREVGLKASEAMPGDLSSMHEPHETEAEDSHKLPSAPPHMYHVMYAHTQSKDIMKKLRRLLQKYSQRKNQFMLPS